MLSPKLERVVCAQSWQSIRVGWSQYKFATQPEFKINKTTTADIDVENVVRPFSEVPMPTKFEFLRGFIKGGKFYQKSTAYMVNYYNQKYGGLFRIPDLFGKPGLVISLNPDDYVTVFRNEGQWPYRRSFDTLVYYRQVYRKDYFQGIEGILSSSDEKWANIRTAINPILLQPKNAKLYLNTMLVVNEEFLKRIREIRDPLTHEMPGTFEEELNRLTFETVAAVALNTHLGLIRKNRDTPEARTILTGLRRFFDLAFELDILPSIWKIVKTPKFYEMMRTLDTLTNICNKYINEALVKIEHDKDGNITSEVDKEKSVLEKLLRIDKRIAVVMAMDMMMAGVDTTSSALTGILLCIAKNPEKQKKLFEEMKQILPQKDSPLNLENMRHLPYLRACIKEGLRMYPIIPGTLRRLPIDLVLSGYHVPAGTEVSLSSNLLLQNEMYVPRPTEYLPERWLRSDAADKLAEITNPFVFLPFGFGPRLCAGRRIVELEMEITIARLVRNFNIEFNYSVEEPFKAKLINVPAIPLKFKFEERNA